MAKRVAVIALMYGWLPGEKGPSRFYYIANMLAEAGYEVELIGGSFQHFEKKPRDIGKISEKKFKFKNTFINVPEYKRNIDPKRLFSNRVAAKNTYNYLKSQKKYDVVYCAIPQNDVSASVATYCNEREIPLIVDVEDLWPEAMNMVFHFPVISNILYAPMKRDAEKTYSLASAVVGTSEDYTSRPFLHRKKNIPAETIYVGCDIEKFDQGVKQNKDKIVKNEGEFWVSYAGSIGTSYDIETLIKAAAEIERQHRYKIKFKIMGTGPLLENMEQLVKTLGCNNVELMGYVDYALMAAYLDASDVVVNSFTKGAPQSIVNKIGDYLSSKSAMINTLENPVFTNIVNKWEFGINIRPENITEMKEAIISLYKNKEIVRDYSNNARKCAEVEFDRKNSYKKILNLVRSFTV